ncbi:uncharacterized protein F4817DRAFT_141337 [Daldinia loculata]|uniref:uncharacterized protein n=1 Tax=Daldinia loculata TaxID=103429 RepID=UPI0020C46BD3|nr:uncharacterized protein F4817DRAFT_141337 [Daldinia loculata]KAI1646485.1 hypothetical protein F4817DRAFT_141337 [Daldinia loculata]
MNGSRQRRTIPNPVPVPPAVAALSRDLVPANACILSFPNTDLDPGENKIVAKALNKIQCPVQSINLDSDNLKQELEDFLRDEGARIIYINAHGSESNDHQLVLSSHRKHGRHTPWSVIKPIIESAQCDVLVFIDSCQAGLVELSPKNKYAKEFITAATWNEKTYSNLAPALGKVLIEWHKNSTTKSAQSLHKYLRDHIKAQRDRRLQDKDDEIKRLRDRKDNIDQDIEERERYLSDKKKQKASLEADIKKKVEERDKIEKEYPQPSHMKASSKTEHWRTNNTKKPQDRKRRASSRRTDI